VGNTQIPRRETELADLRNEAEELHSRMDLAGVLTEQIADFGSFYRRIGREDRRCILHLAIEKISVGKTKYTINWKFAHKPTVVSQRNEEKRSGIDQTLATEMAERSRNEKGKNPLTRTQRSSRSKACNVVEIGGSLPIRRPLQSSRQGRFGLPALCPLSMGKAAEESEEGEA